MTDNFDTALTSGNIAQAFQTVNNVASTLNVVNCSATPASYCATLHRSPCVTRANTCGSCLSGYRGIVGDYNGRCFASNSTTGSTGSACTTDDDCLYNSCDSTSGVCVVPALQCPSISASDVCSGHGSCVYSDLAGRELATSVSCLVTDVASCTAACECTSGYGGLASELQKRSTVRAALCGGISSISSSTDESSDGLGSLASSLSSSYSASEVVSNASYTSCQSALSDLVAIAGEGYLSATSSLSTAGILVSTVSSFIDSGYGNVTVDSTLALDSAVNTISTALLSTMVDGQTAV